jgi:hypothetical protein
MLLTEKWFTAFWCSLESEDRTTVYSESTHIVKQANAKHKMILNQADDEFLMQM